MKYKIILLEPLADLFIPNSFYSPLQIQKLFFDLKTLKAKHLNPIPTKAQSLINHLQCGRGSSQWFVLAYTELCACNWANSCLIKILHNGCCQPKRSGLIMIDLDNTRVPFKQKLFAVCTSRSAFDSICSDIFRKIFWLQFGAQPGKMLHPFLLKN